MIEISNRDGIRIHSLEDWELHAGPVKPNQWQDRRSAKELARAFLSTPDKSRLPYSLEVALNSNDFFKSCTWERGTAELIVKIDPYSSGANLDLVVEGTSGPSPIVMAIEAKADEKFGKLVSVKVREANAKLKSNFGSRLEGLEMALFGRILDEPARNFGYQLLSGIAGTLRHAQTRGARTALFVIWEFYSDNLSNEDLETNRKHVDYVVSLLIGRQSSISAGQFLEIGPLPGNETISNDIDLRILKVQTKLA